MIINDYQFYPTPEAMADRMAEAAMKLTKNVRGREVNILEPSAGTGNLVTALYKAHEIRDRGSMTVDCIEIEENLRAILKENFKDNSDVHIVWDDFSTFETYKKYDCIVMNPPFSEGEKHTLKALSLLRRYGGGLVCILNAETVRNANTQSKKELIQLLGKYNAQMEFISNAFSEAERKTDVEVVLITCSVPEPKTKSRIWEDVHLEKGKNPEEPEIPGYVKKTGGDFIDDLIEQYNFELKATIKLFNEYEGLMPYIMKNHSIKNETYNRPIVSLKLGDSEFSINSYLRTLRYKYWSALFYKPEFTDMLTSNMRNDLFSNLEEMMINYDFNLFNISEIKKALIKNLKAGYEETIIKLFDKLSCVHSYSGEPEETNVWLYNGWKTNKAWKVNDKKVIIPAYGAFKYTWDDKNVFDSYKAYSILSDIEKALNYLDMGETPDRYFTLSEELSRLDKADSVRNLDCKYFKVTFFKKGTCHIVWKNPRIIDKLNIFGSQKKGWLPPAYGKKTYTDMNEEEKAVIDAFQGREEYEKVLNEKDYYLVDTSNMLCLP